MNNVTQNDTLNPGEPHPSAGAWFIFEIENRLPEKELENESMEFIL